MISIVNRLEIVAQIASGATWRTATHMPANKNHADGDEDHGQRYAQQPDNPTKELTQAIAEWSCSIPINAKCGQ